MIGLCQSLLQAGVPPLAFHVDMGVIVGGARGPTRDVQSILVRLFFGSIVSGEMLAGGTGDSVVLQLFIFIFKYSLLAFAPVGGAWRG